MKGVQYKICMEKVAEKNDTKRADYVLTSIEALKGSSGDEISDHDDPQMFALSQAAGRLRGIIALVNSGYLTMEILLNNLEAAARKSYGNLHFERSNTSGHKL